MRLRTVSASFHAFVVASLAARVAVAQQNVLSASDSVSVSARRAGGARSDDAKDPGRDRAERPRVSLAAVRVSGKPGSLEVVGVPVPPALADADSVRYHIVPVGGARVIGRSEGVLASGKSRPRSIMVTVSAPNASLTGKLRVASAEFDGPAGTQPLDVPIEMTVLAVRRVEVTVVDQLVGAHRGDVVTIRFRAVNFGNVADTVRFSAELPTGWRLGGATTQALPTHGTADGSLRVWVPQEAGTGTSVIRVIAKSGASIVAAVDVRVEVETPSMFGAQGPTLTVGSAVTSVAGGPTSTAYVASLQGQLSDSVSVSGMASWTPALTSNGFSNDLALIRLGVPMTQPSLSITAPSAQLGLGLTSRSLSELTGTFVTGNGVSFGGRVGGWKVSGIEARPYVNTVGAARDTGDHGVIENARIEHAIGESNVFVSGAHLDNPFEHRKLDAASMGASFADGPLDGLTSELGYRRAAEVSGLGWSSELRRHSDDGSLSLRAVYAPGGVRAYARATSELSASGARKLSDAVTLNGTFWQSNDRSGTIGASSGDGWSFGPSLALPSLGTSLMLQARGSSLDVTGEGGHFGSSEKAGSLLGDVRRGMYFFNGSASLGQTSQTIVTGGNSLPAVSAFTSDLHGAVGASVDGGTLRVELGTQNYAGGTNSMPSRTTIAFRADHIAIPIIERFRVYANVDVERMGFSIGTQSPWGRRASLTAPLGFGFDVTALAEQSPFITNALGASPWMTAIKVERSMSLPRPVASGESHLVYRDTNGNGRRDRGESGVAGLVVRCGDRTAVTDKDGRFRCGVDEGWSLDPASLPMGWVAPAARSDRRIAGDLGLIEMKAVEVQIELVEVDTMRVTRTELAKLVVTARDSAGQPWFARTLSASRFVFDALPPGRYTVGVDASAIEEPLRMRGTSEFLVGEGQATDVRVTLTGRSMKIRALPPSQSSGPAGSDAPGKASGSSSSRSSSKENRR